MIKKCIYIIIFLTILYCGDNNDNNVNSIVNTAVPDDFSEKDTKNIITKGNTNKTAEKQISNNNTNKTTVKNNNEVQENVNEHPASNEYYTDCGISMPAFDDYDKYIKIGKYGRKYSDIFDFGVEIDETLTDPVNTKREKSYIDDTALLDEYFPRDQRISYDLIAFDESIPENVRREFFKEAYEYLLKILPKSEIERCNKYGIVYLSELSFEHMDKAEIEQGRGYRYTLYKNVKFYRLMLRDPKKYDPLFKAKLTYLFDELLTGRLPYKHKLSHSFFENNKKLILEYLYYAFSSSSIMDSDSFLDPKFIIDYIVKIPGIAYEKLIGYFIEKEKRIPGSLFAGFEFLSSAMLNNIPEETYRKLYEYNLMIIDSDVSINASIEAIIQATIASYFIQAGKSVLLPYPKEIRNFLCKYTLKDSLVELIIACSELMRTAYDNPKISLYYITQKYITHCLSYRMTSMNNSFHQWDKQNDAIIYITKAMEVRAYVPDIDNKYLIRELYRDIYIPDYPYLFDFYFPNIVSYLNYDTEYFYKLSAGENNFKWYKRLRTKTVLPFDIDNIINETTGIEYDLLGAYKDLTGLRLLFHKETNGVDSLMGIGNNFDRSLDINILLDNFHFTEPPRLFSLHGYLLVVGWILDDEEHQGTSRVAKIDINSGELEWIPKSEDWRDILFIENTNTFYYRKGEEEFIYDLDKNESYRYNSLFYCPDKIIDFNKGYNKVIYLKKIHGTDRDGVYVFDRDTLKTYMIDYYDQLLYVDGSNSGNYISYKTINPFYKIENTYILNLKRN